MNEVALKEETGVSVYTGPTGTEDLDSDDIILPRIKLGQGTSEEVKSGQVAEGELFLNINGESLASPDDPLLIVPLTVTKEYILWRDRKDEGGGIMARAKRNGDGTHRWDKPNQEFKNKIGGKRAVTWKTGECIEEDGLGLWGSSEGGDSAPAATVTYNYVVMLPEHNNMVAVLSLSRTQVGPAKQFNTLLKMMCAKVPMQQFQFGVKSVDDNRGNDKFKNYKFLSAGKVDGDTYELAMSISESINQSNVSFEMEQEAAPKNDDL